MSGETDPNALRGDQRSTMAIPDGACDSHVHVFNKTAEELPAEVSARMPYGIPKGADLDDLMAMLGAIGADRVVIVQTPANGTMDQFADLVAGAGPEVRGVARIDDSTTDAELDRLHAAGVRGCRFGFVKFLKMYADLDVVRRAAARIADRGWHMCMHMEPSDLLDLADFLETLPVPVVIDHLAHLRIAEGTNQPAFRKMLSLLEKERYWAKIGNQDRWSPAGPPGYEDSHAFTRQVVEVCPDRAIWCTDWPNLLYADPYHPNGTLPNCGRLIDAFAAAVDPATLKAVLVDNPARLYDY